jgi:hypothetical protein
MGNPPRIPELNLAIISIPHGHVLCQYGAPQGVDSEKLNPIRKLKIFINRAHNIIARSNPSGHGKIGSGT